MIVEACQIRILNNTLFLRVLDPIPLHHKCLGLPHSGRFRGESLGTCRLYEHLKQRDSVEKRLPTVVGSEVPTIIQPPLYKARFTNSMGHYFMMDDNLRT
jgi:hypothetical protein